MNTSVGPLMNGIVGPLSADQDGGEAVGNIAFSSHEADTGNDLSEERYFKLVLVNVLVGCWLIYTLYFNSRVFGFIISAIVSRTTKMDFDLGSFSVSVLSGKVMFK